jgi:hypothetical protein
MPTNYTAQPGTSKTPSPAPGPGVQPIVSLPADTTDDVNAASVAQAMEVPADFIGHIQGAVRLDTPIVPASASGFTAPSYTSFGGTVTPSGSVKINTGTRFVIKIIAGGAVGVATFQTSVDGGNTFGATQTTSASMTDATSGITLAFAGTLTVNGTATFRSAYTPLAQWQDGGANGRWLIDHNGFPTGGRICKIEENWLAAPTQTGSVWGAVLGTGAAIAVQAPVASFNASFLKLTPSTTAGATNYCLFDTTPLVIANTPGMSMVVEFEVGLNAAAAGVASNTSWFFGVDAGVDPGGADVNLVGLLKRHNNANWQFLSGAGGLQAITAATVATPPTAGTSPTDRIRIELHGSASPLGVYQARFFVNEVLIGTVVAANLPGATAMRIVMGSFNEGGAPSGAPFGYVGPLVAVWNRFTSGPAF